ncbi:hypothetical protein [Klebsiella sp. 141240]|nr:hypothetical protein [Klebsiella aerogenes]HCU2332995.1 hypothetical protein [Klebsiella aerogenes]
MNSPKRRSNVIAVELPEAALDAPSPGYQIAQRCSPVSNNAARRNKR